MSDETTQAVEAEVVEDKQPDKPAPEKKDLVQQLVHRPRPQLMAREDGVIVGRSFEEQWRMADALCSSGLVPKALNTPAKVWTAMQFAYELGLRGVVTALRNIMVLPNGQPAIWGDLPLSLIKQSRKLKAHTEYYFDKDGNRIAAQDTKAEIYGAFCSFERNDEAGVAEAAFTVDDAKRAGLLTKETYKAYLKDMLKYRARGRAAKDKFPDVLMGAPIAEFDAGIMGGGDGGEYEGEQGAALAPQLSAKLNDRFLGQPS